MFVKTILTFLGVTVVLPIIVNCDNVGAIFLAYNAKTSARTKHVDIKYHYVREYVTEGVVAIKFVRSEENDSDIYTKNTNRDIHARHTLKSMEQRHE